MCELISRQTAIDALRAIKQGLWEIDIPSPTVPEYVEHHEQIKNMMEIVDGWIKRVKAEPSVDAVPVVRCRDCKHFDLNHWETINRVPLIVAHEICTFWGRGCKTNVDGYCFKGERREE